MSARGQHRQQALLDAAGELLMEQGFAALSHRSIAARAELPLSATTYYFASLDVLVHGAVQGIAAAWLEAARSAIEALAPALEGPRQVADAVLAVVAFGPGDTKSADVKTVLTMYERYLEAARHPHLRSVIDEYDDHLDTFLVEVLRRAGLPESRDTARLVLAVVDGALLRALAEGLPLTSARAPLERLLRMLAAPPNQATA